MSATDLETCPICGVRSASIYLPFCSSKCAYVDLDHWFKESYTIPETTSDKDKDVPEGSVHDTSLIKGLH